MTKRCEYWEIVELKEAFDEEATEIGYTHSKGRAEMEANLLDRLEEAAHCGRCDECKELEAFGIREYENDA